MGSVAPLLSFLLMIAAGWVHRHQLIVIEFLQAENRLLKDRLRGRMLQIGRNVTDSQSGALRAKRYLIIDRDSKYSEQFRRLIRDSGTEVIRLPPMSPNLNAYAERFVRSIKEECLGKMIFIGQASLRRAISEYITHYHTERNHQGLENQLIWPDLRRAANDGVVHRRPRLGGSRVETAHYCAIPPSEPCVIVSHHTAQASTKAPCGTRFNNYASRHCEASYDK